MVVAVAVAVAGDIPVDGMDDELVVVFPLTFTFTFAGLLFEDDPMFTLVLVDDGLDALKLNGLTLMGINPAVPAPPS